MGYNLDEEVAHATATFKGNFNDDKALINHINKRLMKTGHARN